MSNLFFSRLKSQMILTICGVLALSLCQAQQSKPFTVVLDAGHGGHDPGKVSGGYNEKDIALKIVLLTGSFLESYTDIRVIYTRKTDVFVDLYKRAEIANKANADLFVSVHCNAHYSNVDGSETYILGLHANQRNFEVAKAENEVIRMEKDYKANYQGYDIDSPESVIGITITQEEFLEQSRYLADLVQRTFTKDLGRSSRGVKQAGFIVLHQTFTPSVLIETGFITNKNERAFLASKTGQKRYAQSIGTAILDYKHRFSRVPTRRNEYGTPVSDAPVKTVVEDFPEEPIEEPTTDPQAVSSKDIANVDTIATNIGKTFENVGATGANVIYRVQLFSSSKKLDLDAPELKGFSSIVVEQEGGLYRYLLGNAPTFENAQNLKNMATEKGFYGCFVVAYKGNRRIPLKEAKILQSNP